MKAASDASDERGHLGEIIFVGFGGKPICVGVNYVSQKNEFTGRNGDGGRHYAVTVDGEHRTARTERGILRCLAKMLFAKIGS